MDCGALSNPVNGSVHYTAGTTFRQKANYSCNTGYNLVGDNTRTCEATGEWSGSAPTCQGVLSLTHMCACVYVVGASIWLYPSVCIKLEGILFLACAYIHQETQQNAFRPCILSRNKYLVEYDGVPSLNLSMILTIGNSSILDS